MEFTFPLRATQILERIILLEAFEASRSRELGRLSNLAQLIVLFERRTGRTLLMGKIQDMLKPIGDQRTAEYIKEQEAWLKAYREVEAASPGAVK